MVRQTLPVVQTAGLCKTFKDFWHRPRVEAVKDLNLDIQPGEVFGLLGPNGSGKSTTIKMLLGLLYPTRGRISVFGKAPTDVAVKARIVKTMITGLLKLITARLNGTNYLAPFPALKECH